MSDTKISALTALTGANVVLADDLLAIVDTSVATTKSIKANELGIALNLYFVGADSRDMTAASGNVSYTGVGFKPKAILLLSSIHGTAGAISWGFDDATTRLCKYDDAATTAGTYQGTTFSIFVQTAVGASQKATVNSFDSDGFTLAWTKTGSPTGTLSFYYLALR